MHSLNSYFVSKIVLNSFVFQKNKFAFYSPFSDGSNYGINGNMSLNRQGELASPQHRYDLSMGSDKSSSLSHSEGGVYDVVQAEENRINNQQSENNGNSSTNELYPTNGHSTLDSRDGSESSKRKVRSSKMTIQLFKSECNTFVFTICILFPFCCLAVSKRKIIFPRKRNTDD